MAKRRRLTTAKSIAQRIKEGRGAGEGAEYKPWLTIQDVPSRGRCHRIKGWRHGRVHHLLSDLEAYVFYVYEWTRSVIDIREQYPLLPLEETLWIAERMGVRHPTDPVTRHPVIMTTDFFLTISRGLQRLYLPRTVKYLNELSKPRSLEKLEIERRYWDARSKKLYPVTEFGLPMQLVHNVRWVHRHHHPSELQPLTEHDIDVIATFLTRAVLEADAPLRTLTSACDRKLGLDEGTSLAVVRHLLASRRWEVDMTKRIHPDERLTLIKTSNVKLLTDD